MVGNSMKIYNLCVMKLYLLRHAKTEQAAPEGRDIDRNLLPKGRNQAADGKRQTKKD